MEVIDQILYTMWLHDNWTFEHSMRVANYAVKIGKNLHYENEKLRQLWKAGLLHDVGKICIPSQILDFPGKLNPENFSLMRSHTDIGYEILKTAHLPEEICEVAKNHHERFDGKGYHHEKAVSDYSKIICIADSFDAMSHNRPYRKAKSLGAICEDFKRNAGSQFDPDFVRVFLHTKHSQLPAFEGA